MSKSDFIRAQPPTMPSSEVIARAKAAGIKLDRVLVYKVRQRAGVLPLAKTLPRAGSGDAGRRKVVAHAARRTAQRQAAGVPRPIANSSEAERLLVAVAAEVGLARSLEILRDARRKLLDALGR